jgi:hypothetical protein
MFEPPVYCVSETPGGSIRLRSSLVSSAVPTTAWTALAILCVIVFGFAAFRGADFLFAAFLAGFFFAAFDFFLTGAFAFAFERFTFLAFLAADFFFAFFAIRASEPRQN